ncbi:hypothetical protein BDZ89DRAFT_1072711 [Hymenopellis radicata]|nr:hypothetical protein BDZ89DRAFT_1072711 [Hymenopellis radicata]
MVARGNCVAVTPSPILDMSDPESAPIEVVKEDVRRYTCSRLHELVHIYVTDVQLVWFPIEVWRILSSCQLSL